MLATINTPKVQAPFGVSLLHPSSLAKGYDSSPPSLHPWQI